ncbi:hypothetical protein BG004_003484 [Podila humilis]|nr:hypothetical protein BG004_003484 [Podila humilis]
MKFGTLVDALVFIAVAGASLVVPVVASEGVVELSVMTFNIYFLPELFFPWAQRTRADMIAASEFIKGHDTLVIEECFDNTACDKLKSNLKKVEYPYFTPTVGTRGRGSMSWTSTSGSIHGLANGGVVIFSKWPIKEAHQCIYKHYCGSDGASDKGFAQVIIDYKGTNLHVYGTHMQSDDRLCFQGMAAKARKQNLDYWYSWMRGSRVPADELIILAGDFNIERRSAESNRLVSSDLGLLEPSLYLGHPYTLDFKDNSIARYNGGPSEYLDYVFVEKNHSACVKNITQNVLRIKSPAFSLMTGSFNDYSDHFPVHVIIEVSGL